MRSSRTLPSQVSKPPSQGVYTCLLAIHWLGGGGLCMLATRTKQPRFGQKGKRRKPKGDATRAGVVARGERMLRRIVAP